MGGGPSHQEPLTFLEQPQDVDPESVGVRPRLCRLARGTGPVLDASNVVGAQGKQSIVWHGRLPRPVRLGMAGAYAAGEAGFELRTGPRTNSAVICPRCPHPSQRRLNALPQLVNRPVVDDEFVDLPEGDAGL